MAACEKCWSDAAFLAFNSNADQATIYASLVKERAANPCTPEQQCGEMHLVLDMLDGTKRCRCGKVKHTEADRFQKKREGA